MFLFTFLKVADDAPIGRRWVRVQVPSRVCLKTFSDSELTPKQNILFETAQPLEDFHCS